MFFGGLAEISKPGLKRGAEEGVEEAAGWCCGGGVSAVWGLVKGMGFWDELVDILGGVKFCDCL